MPSDALQPLLPLRLSGTPDTRAGMVKRMELWQPSLDTYGNRHEQGLVQPKSSWRTLNHRCLQCGAVSQPERLGLSGKVRPFHIHASLPTFAKLIFFLLFKQTLWRLCKARH